MEPLPREPASPPAPLTAPRPDYLSLERWSATRDGYFSLGDRLNHNRSQSRSALPVPVWLPNTTVVRLMATRLTQPSGEEALILRILQWLLPRVCATRGSSRAVVVDSGANEGAWSLIAASYGCRSVAIEPQGECVHLIRAAAKASKLESHVAIVQTMLSTIRTTAQVPRGQCHGTAQFLIPGACTRAAWRLPQENRTSAVDWRHHRCNRAGVSDTTAAGRNLLNSADSRALGRDNVSSASLDELLLMPKGRLPDASPDDRFRRPAGARECGEMVALWHLDAEGAEIDAASSALLLLRGGCIERVVAEAMPASWGAHGVNVSAAIGALRALFRGWHCVALCGSRRRFDWTIESFNAALAPRRKYPCLNVYCVKPELEAELEAMLQRV